MNNITETVESVNYDYLPGEPDSRRVWYITLRTPPPPTLRAGMFVRHITSHHPNTMLSNDMMYRVNDIHGRHIVVVPMSTLPTRSQDYRVANVRMYKPSIYGNGIGHNRMGRTLYTSRPLSNNVRSYIEF